MGYLINLILFVIVYTLAMMIICIIFRKQLFRLLDWMLGLK
jgi:hypothetical protein